MLNLLTATGARPKAFQLCKRWMERQTYASPVHWVIVDDGPVPQDYSFGRDWAMSIIRPEPFWELGQNTQARNLLAGLVAIEGPTVIIEDDDWYAPTWLERISAELERAEIVGQSHSIYYNVRTGTKRDCNNSTHASLCATAVRDGGLKRFRDVCRTNAKFIDAELWRYPNTHLFRDRLVVGLKGLPGRENIGIGRNLTGQRDKDRALLRELIGEDADAYGDELW